MKITIFISFTLFTIIISDCSSNDTTQLSNEYDAIFSIYKSYEGYENYSPEFFELLARNFFNIMYYSLNPLISTAESIIKDCDNRIQQDSGNASSYNKIKTNANNIKTQINNKITTLKNNQINKQELPSTYIKELLNCYNEQYKGYIKSVIEQSPLFVTRETPSVINSFAPFIITGWTKVEIYIGQFDYGGITLGFCEYSNCTNTKFSGINIAYFGENCYHIDYFVDNEYTITGRSCLSKYELYHLYLFYDKSSINIGTYKEVTNNHFYFFTQSTSGDRAFCGSILNEKTVLRINNL